MSILLESLNQTKHSHDALSGNSVPSVNDTHFDDEMLSDEWLFKKIFFWKIISGLLLVVLLGSWVGFYFYSGNSKDKVDSQFFKLEQQNKMIAAKKLPDNMLETKLPSQKGINHKPQQVTDNKQADAIATDETSAPIKEKYQPKKIKPSNKPNGFEKAIAKPLVTQNASHQATQVVEFESLSDAEKQELPELEISSYAVSSNTKKSFVVLNGAFYAQGETITPHLVLVSIEKEGILMRYKGRLISKKYSL